MRMGSKIEGTSSEDNRLGDVENGKAFMKIESAHNFFFVTSEKCQRYMIPGE